MAILLGVNRIAIACASLWHVAGIDGVSAEVRHDRLQREPREGFWGSLWSVEPRNCRGGFALVGKP